MSIQFDEQWGQPPTTGDFITKDSGEREHFETGMQRDSQEGKGRFDLIPYESLKRVAQLYERGALKYEARNWEKGQPYSRATNSMLRHAMQAAAGLDDEDHFAAVVFNALAVMAYQERTKAGVMSPQDAEDDLPKIYRERHTDG